MKTDKINLKTWNEIIEKEKTISLRKKIIRSFYRLYYILKLDFIFNIHNEIKYFFQRGYKGYSDRDVWSADYYIAKTVSKIITQLNKKKNGYPYGLSTKEWGNILKKIAKSFNQASKIVNLDIAYAPLDKKYTIKDYNINKQIEKKVNKKFPRIYKCKILTIKEGKEFQEGFDLFKKYFFDLWD